MPNNITLIANPIAGGGTSRTAAIHAAELFDRRGADIRLEWTAAVGHATQLAREAMQRGAARIVVCGMIAGYNDELPSETMHHLSAIVIKRLSLRGFIVLDHYDLYPEFSAAMIGWLKEGKVKSRDTVHDGLDSAPKAFLGLFSGDNTGKMLVKLADR